MITPFCENCGSPINPEAKFCRNCGTGLTQPAVNVQPNPVQAQSFSPARVPASSPQASPVPASITPAPNEMGSEPIFGVILFKEEKSFGRWDTFNAVVTGQRLIFAQMTSEMMKAAAQQAREQAKADGKGFFGQWSDQLKATYGYSRKYLAMSPSAILAETLGNFELINNAISEINLKERFKREDQGVYEFEVQIHSTAGKYEFLMDQNNDYVKLLKRVYGERVKTPFGHFSKTVNIKF
ncbi:MAG: zinc ribbon domain-containing protein [Candidatus Bathyarchaeia archaeon]